jgi:hypothetical protein
MGKSPFLIFFCWVTLPTARSLGAFAVAGAVREPPGLESPRSVAEHGLGLGYPTVIT